MKNTSTLSAMLAKSQTSQAVVGCIETLNQGYEFLETLQPEDYTYIAQPHVSSSIGEHYRHSVSYTHLTLPTTMLV